MSFFWSSPPVPRFIRLYVSASSPFFSKSVKDKTFKFSAILKSYMYIFVVPFAYMGLRCYFRSSPDCNKKKPLLFQHLFFNTFFSSIDRGTFMNAEYVICLKSTHAISRFWASKSYGQISRGILVRVVDLCPGNPGSNPQFGMFYLHELGFEP